MTKEKSITGAELASNETPSAVHKNISDCQTVHNITGGEVESDLQQFYNEWYGPAFGPPEHLDRIQKRHDKARIEFADRLKTFLTERGHLKTTGDNIKLSGDDAIAFAEAIINPPEPNDALRKAARDHIASTGRISEWRPISEAPRDGTAITAYDFNRKYRADVIFNGREWEEIDGQCKPKGIGFYPTHWRDRPAAPGGE